MNRSVQSIRESFNRLTGSASSRRRAKASGVHRARPGVEVLGQRILPSANDQITEAIGLGAMTQTRTYSGESISVGTDVDMYSISLSAGQRIAIDIDRPSGSLDSWVNLFDGNGQRLAYNDDGPNPSEPFSVESYLEFTSSSGGVIYIGVSGFGNANYSAITGNGDTNGSTGGYLLVVSPVSGGAPAGDSDDQISEAISLGAITQVRAYSASISPGMDVDMYAVSLTSGQRIAIDIDRPLGSSFDSWVSVFDGNGLRLAYNDDGPNPIEPSSLESFLEFTPSNGGVIYIGVSGFGNANYSAVTGNGDTNGSTGGYLLVVSPVSGGAPAGDFDDQINEAIGLGAITQTRTYSGESISVGTDVDMYSISVTAGQRIAIDIDRPSGSLDSWVSVFDGNGQRLAYNDDGPNPSEPFSVESYLEFTSSSGGVIYIGVSGFGNANYNAVTGNGDTNGSTGGYNLVVTPLSSGLDLRNTTPIVDYASHVGADYLADPGTALLSPVSGRVVHVGPVNGYGTMAVAVEVTLPAARTFTSELSGTSVTTSRLIVIFGHLRPSRNLVANPDPWVRFQQGQPELGYQVGSFITAGQRLGYIERPDYADHDSVSHVHVTMSDGVNPPANIWLGRGLSSNDPLRARYIRPELAWDLLT